MSLRTWQEQQWEAIAVVGASIAAILLTNPLACVPPCVIADDELGLAGGVASIPEDVALKASSDGRKGSGTTLIAASRGRSHRRRSHSPLSGGSPTVLPLATSTSLESSCLDFSIVRICADGKEFRFSVMEFSLVSTDGRFGLFGGVVGVEISSISATANSAI